MERPTYLKSLLNKALAMKVPVSGTFELTARCNLDCGMCYIHKAENDPVARQKELPTDFWLDLVRQIQDAGALTLLLSGGEPVLHPGFREIYLACKKAGLILSLNSNGTMFTPDDIAFFSENPPAKINISLYGASRETYQKQCGNGLMFDRVTETIRRLREKNIGVRINLTVTEQNRQDIAAIYRFARSLEIPVSYTTYLFPPKRASENGFCAACRHTPEQAAALSLVCDREKFGQEEFRLRKKAIEERAPLLTEEECGDLRDPTERIRCRAGTSAWWATFDGRLLPCAMLADHAVDLKTRSFQDAWREIRRLTDQIYLPSACTDCSLRQYCHVCAAICYCENGSTEAVPTYMCEMTRAYLKALREVEV